MKKFYLLLSMLAFIFGMAQTPTTNAPVPTKLQANVISIFSDSYTNVANNYNPNWGQSGSVNPNFIAVSGSGNNILAYTNFNYQGTDLATQNAAGMEYLHIDIWTANATNVKVSPINNGTGAGEFLVNVPLVSGGWSSVDLPKSAFTGMTWDSVFQLKFDGQGGVNPSNIYLDNIYFWKTAVSPASDATLSDLKVNGTSIAGFGASTLSYTYALPNGTTTIPTVTATPTQIGATAIVIQATSLPGTATVNVTSQDGTVTKTYMVNFVLEGPAVAAPTPPARFSSNVISLFSNAYTNIPVDAWSATWDDSSVQDVQIAGNDTKKITFANFLGIDFSGAGHHIDLSSFTNFHMDFYTDNADLVGKVFNQKLSQWSGTSGEVSALELNINTGTTPAIVSGQWVSVDVPMTAWSNNTVRNDIAQYVITSNLGVVYVDNIYFYKGGLAVNDVNGKNKLSIYPNPVKSGENITVSSKVKNVEIYNMNGQQVRTSNSQSINSQGLEKGMYLVKATNSDGSVSTTKLIVK